MNQVHRQTLHVIHVPAVAVLAVLVLVLAVVAGGVVFIWTRRR